MLSHWLETAQKECGLELKAKTKCWDSTEGPLCSRFSFKKCEWLTLKAAVGTWRLFLTFLLQIFGSFLIDLYVHTISFNAIDSFNAILQMLP